MRKLFVLCAFMAAIMITTPAHAGLFGGDNCTGNSCNPVSVSGGDVDVENDNDLRNTNLNTNFITVDPVMVQGQTTDVNIGGGVLSSTLSPSARSDADASIRNSGNSESDSVALSGSLSGSESGASSSNELSITNNEASIPKPAAASPAAVYVDMCSGGASVSTPGGGATLGNGDAFCKKLALADAFFRADAACVTSETVTCSMRNEAMMLLKEALSDLHRQTFVSRFFDWIPIVGFLF